MKLAVTGGATGIGAAVLDILSEQGHELTVFDIREPAQTAITYIPLDLMVCAISQAFRLVKVMSLPV